MFPRTLSCTLIIFVLSIHARAAEVVVTDESCSQCQRQTPRQTVVYQPVEKPAPVATWWANSALGKFYRSCCRDAKRINCWPQPFVKADRLTIRQTFNTMVANGLERQNTLGDHHFVGDTGKLNRAGQRRIREILLEGLPYRRDLYVYRAERPSETTTRVKSVHQYAAMVVRGGVVPPIRETNIPPRGWPASTVDLVDKKYTNSMPDPRLPSAQQSDEEQ